GVPASPEDLVRHRCLVYGHSTTLQRWSLLRDGQEISVPVNSLLCSNNGDVLRAAAVAGQGISVLPTFLVGSDVRSGRLAVVLPQNAPTSLGVYALYAPNRFLAAKTRIFVDVLADR